jgi:hypothetical protein
VLLDFQLQWHRLVVLSDCVLSVPPFLCLVVRIGYVSSVVVVFAGIGRYSPWACCVLFTF